MMISHKVLADEGTVRFLQWITAEEMLIFHVSEIAEKFVTIFLKCIVNVKH